jgi:hypothetical protein
MSNTVNVGNFSVECFHSPSPVPVGEPIADYQSVILTLVPDEGYVIDAANFSVIVPLPDYVSSVVFSQSEQNPDNITCLVNLTPGAVMPDSDINIDLCISGRAEFVSYCVSGTVVWNKIAHVTPVTLNNPYNLCGSYGQVSNVFTQAISADAGFYFEQAPTIQLTSGNINNYTVSTENVLDAQGNIITTVFTVNYTFTNENVTNDIWTINGEAKIIYVPTIEITSYNISTAAFPAQGGFRYYTIYGAPGANWSLNASDDILDTGLLTPIEFEPIFGASVSGTIGVDGFSPVGVKIPNVTSNASYTITISGDLQNPFSQNETITLLQFTNTEVTYTASGTNLTVTPSYEVSGLSYSQQQPNIVTNVAYTISSSIPGGIITIIDPVINTGRDISNSVTPNIQFTVTGTNTTHVVTDASEVLNGMNFIGNTQFSNTISVVSVDAIQNTVTFNQSISVTIGQVETLGLTKGNDVLFQGYSYSGDEFNLLLTGNNNLQRFGWDDVTFNIDLDNTLSTVTIPTIVTTGVSNETGTQADSGGESITDGGGTISSKGIQWSEFADFNTVLGANDEGTGTADFASTITGLTIGNTYYVRAYAQNEVGVAYGEVIGFVSNISIPCNSTQASGNAGVTDLNINLNSGGGLIAVLFDAIGVPDKMEIIHGGPAGTKVATSGMTVANAGPFDDVYGTEPSNTVPTQGEAAATNQFIGTNVGTIPTRQTQFTNETGFVTNMTTGNRTYQQIVWWQYDAADWQTAPNVTVRVTGSGGTTWFLARLCCPDASCTPSNPPT